MIRSYGRTVDLVLHLYQIVCHYVSYLILNARVWQNLILVMVSIICNEAKTIIVVDKWLNSLKIRTSTFRHFIQEMLRHYFLFWTRLFVHQLVSSKENVI